jgi:membrane protease YdiL (CAAX protease family)
MDEAGKLINLLYVIFILLLALSGSFGGLMGELIYYLAFFIPILIGFYYSKELQRKREEVKGVAEPPDRLLSFDKVRAVKLAPLVAPSILVIFFTSLTTSVILSFFGITASPVEDVGIIRMLLIHALIPAVLEELLFRYVPLKLIAPYSRKWCIIYSAICFSLIHCSFVQMPYAFVAGFIFILIDVMLGSVWPSIIMHFLNNAVSVMWMKYASGIGASVIFTVALVLLAIVSLIFALKRREEYKTDLIGAFETAERNITLNIPIILTVICFYLAWTAL